jgi:hypothetical protein
LNLRVVRPDKSLAAGRFRGAGGPEGECMRKTNWRLVIVGLVLVVLAFGFFAGMGLMGSRSNDPVAMMQTVGMVSGVVGALGVVMAVFGFIGRRTA